MSDNWVVSTLEDALSNWNDKLACVCKRNSDGHQRSVINLTVIRNLKNGRNEIQLANISYS